MKAECGYHPNICYKFLTLKTVWAQIKLITKFICHLRLGFLCLKEPANQTKTGFSLSCET